MLRKNTDRYCASSKRGRSAQIRRFGGLSECRDEMVRNPDQKREDKPATIKKAENVIVGAAVHQMEICAVKDNPLMELATGVWKDVASIYLLDVFSEISHTVLLAGEK